ncbi:COX5B-domain-containing protein [Phanerochaete sordida]|uniref:COX5B-domain-containing protein n=1 Tax=Phanerochaete sordida TaxID=48140 RepID=A0A9P3LAX7_9APHY|nr:COX5B-domain-containing protein [Phanerochaete sordida]
MLRAAIRPAFSAARASKSAARTFSVSALRASEHKEGVVPELFPPGAPVGTVATDDIHATGIERLQVLGEMTGTKVFDYDPLDSSRIGTMKDPIKVLSWDDNRIIGCTGSPAESHELHWMTLKLNERPRCPECGSVYELDFKGDLELLNHQKAHAHH